MTPDLVLNLVEGWTEPLRQQLFTDPDGGGVYVPADLTGKTMAIEISRESTGAAVTLTGAPTVENAATGIVKFSPGANDFKAADSPLLLRWRGTDGAGKIVFFPQREAMRVIVRKP